MALAKKLIMVVMAYRSMAQNLSSMMGILLKPKMNMNLVVVRVKVMRLMLIDVTFLMKTLMMQNAQGKGHIKALIKSRNMANPNISICINCMNQKPD